MECKSILTLCFTEAAETFRRWKVFSPGSDGVCVVFEKERLLADQSDPSVRRSPVDYYTLDRLRREEPVLDQTPFSKRAAYCDEKEFRLLFCSSTEELSSKGLSVSVPAIDRIVVNPWLAEPLFITVRDTIRSIPGWEVLEVLQSKVLDGPAWKAFAAQVESQADGTSAGQYKR